MMSIFMTLGVTWCAQGLLQALCSGITPGSDARDEMGLAAC